MPAMRIALLAVLAFTSCGALGWSWQRYAAFTDFGSFQSVDGLGSPLASDVHIEDFEGVGHEVVIFTREGVFITDGSGGFVPADFPDLRR